MKYKVSFVNLFLKTQNCMTLWIICRTSGLFDLACLALLATSHGFLLGAASRKTTHLLVPGKVVNTRISFSLSAEVCAVCPCRQPQCVPLHHTTTRSCFYRCHHIRQPGTRNLNTGSISWPPFSFIHCKTPTRS